MSIETVFALERAPWPALQVETGGTIHRANAAAINLLGPGLERPGVRLSAIWSPENKTSAEQFLAEAEQSSTRPSTVKFRGKAGQTYSRLVSACAFASEGKNFVVLQFLPEPAPLEPLAPGQTGETTFFHKQKLDCALQLARTVALDFNNALTSILGHVSLILSKVEPENPWRPSLLEIEKSAGRAAEIANDLGNFSRQEKDLRAQATGNLNAVLQRAVHCFQQSPGAAPIQWELLWEKRLFAAKFDEAKLQQAFARILENAIQAITAANGRILVETRNVELAEPVRDQNVRLVPGAYVCAEISDDGCGIAREVLPRVFEPFFTTKQDHRGLGLAWVYGIVTNHGGAVAVSSQQGAGTAVRVYLPADKSVVSESAVNASDLSGKETILMVDDEELVLTMGQAILSNYGYRVLIADNGRKALELLQGNERVSLVITDLVMPGMSGRELLEHIERVAPSTPVLCVSGYVWPAGQENEKNYLQKPFTSQDLLLKVKSVLGAQVKPATA